MSGVRKWLGGSVALRWHRWELLAIALIVIVLSVVWPGAPFWVFFLIGVVMGIAEPAGRDFGRWLRRRSAA